jgi:outer membrane protein assembly factor BamB
LFISFLHDKAVYTTALDLEGKQVWQTKITDYKLHQGYGSSPAIYKSLVIVSADNKLGGAVCGLNRTDGKIVWRVERPKFPNYPSPIILEVGGKEQMILTGCELISSYDPMTGALLWETEGATTECVTSTVTDGKHVFTSGGYPKNHVSAIAADGSGKLIWENGSRVYVPSMYVKDGHLYGMMDAGVFVCWKSDTGDRLWRERIGEPFTASPVPVGDLVYAASEMGGFYVVKASPAGAEVIAKNQLGDQIYATPVIVDGQIFARVAHDENDRRVEKLYCLENQEK